MELTERDVCDYAFVFNGIKRLSKPTQDEIRKIYGPAAGVMAVGRKITSQGDDSGDVGVRSL